MLVLASRTRPRFSPALCRGLSKLRRIGLIETVARRFPRRALSIHTCRRQYPGGAPGCHCRSLPLVYQPSPRFPGGSTSTLLFSGSAQRSLLVAARVVAKPPKVALYIEGFDRFVTSTTTPIATGWRGSCRVGLSPTGRAHVFTAHGIPG